MAVQLVRKFRDCVYHPTFRRWTDLAFLTVVSLFLLEILAPEVETLSFAVADRSRDWPPVLNFVSAAVLTWIVCTLLARLGALSVGQFSHEILFGFPPIWISAICGSFVVLVLRGRAFTGAFDEPTWALVGWLCWWVAPVLLGVTIALAQGAKMTKRSSVQTPVTNVTGSTVSGDSLFPTEQHLLSWLEDEKPIRLPLEDIFGFSVTARRIARILRAERMRTVGVVGPFGTGKTSLLNLAEYYLDKRHVSLIVDEPADVSFTGPIVVCRVDGWGRSKGSIAESILAMVLNEVASVVDCSSVISLPANYRKAIGGIRSLGGAVLEALFETSHDAAAQIKKLDRILIAARVRLVIILEDLDRNTADEIIRDEIPGLLDRLRGMKNISFILAIGTEHQYSQILVRICDYVESIA